MAAAALAAVAGYAALLGTLQGQAMGLGRAHATASGWPEAAVHALPQPLSPFHWKIVLREGDRYRVTDVELRGAPARAIVDPEAGWLDRLAAGYRPPSAANWRAQALTGDDAAEAALARAAWHDPALAGFRRFAMFPALEAVRTEGARHCVRFLDLRFALPGLPAAFRYEACRQARGGSWELRRVRGAFGID